MATEMKLLKLGTVCLDGTKIHANASRHSALSHGHIVKLEAQLKQQVQPMIKVLQEQAPKLGTVTTLVADTGYCSQNNVKACEEANIEPLLSVARQDHHPHWCARFTEPAPLSADATAMQAMTHRLSTIAGKVAYAGGGYAQSRSQGIVQRRRSQRAEQACHQPHSTGSIGRASADRAGVFGRRAKRPNWSSHGGAVKHCGVMDSLILPWVNAHTMSMFLFLSALQRDGSAFRLEKA